MSLANYHVANYHLTSELHVHFSHHHGEGVAGLDDVVNGGLPDTGQTRSWGRSGTPVSRSHVAQGRWGGGSILLLLFFFFVMINKYTFLSFTTADILQTLSPHKKRKKKKIMPE